MAIMHYITSAFCSQSHLVTRSSRHTVILSQAAIQDTPMIRPPKVRLGPKIQWHADIKGHYQRAKCGCHGPLTGDSRG